MSKHFRFFDLPLELRQSVYELYLQANLSLPTAQVQHEPQSLPCPIPLFLTSKQTHDEISYILRHMQTLHMRISWREMTFDPLALLCLKQRERGRRQSTPTRFIPSVNYATIKYLRIEIHSPSQNAGRRAGEEMIQILVHMRILCEHLRTTPCLHHLVIEFIGTTWSDYLGRPQESFEEQFRTHEILRCVQEGVIYNPHYPSPPTCHGNPEAEGGHHDHRQCQLFDFAQTDVTSVLDMFGLMANVKSAKIHLPESLKGNQGLVRMKRIREAVLMNTDPWSQEAGAMRPRYWNTTMKLWSLA